MKIYLLPGLGFDHRIFQKLDLADFDTSYLDWIEPLQKESFRNYAKRLSKPIIEQDEKTVLIGHSLGGMMAQEIAHLKKVDQIILISSIQSRAELPFYFKIIQPLYLHRILNKRMTLLSFPLWAKWHDYDAGEQQALFRDMVNKQSNLYFQWALSVLSTWRKSPPKIPSKIFQIHGDRDRTLPSYLVKKPDQLVENAGHFMVYKHPELISKTIVKVLKKM